MSGHEAARGPDDRRRVTSRIAVRPSRVGKAVLLVTALLAFFALNSPVLIGPVATLVVLGLADGALAWWRLRRIRIDITLLRSVAGPPDPLTCSIAALGATVPVTVALLAGQRVAGRVLITPGTGPVRASFRYAQPHRRNYLDYRIVISTIGLAVARRDELVVVESGVFQGPPTAVIDELDPPLARVEPELERLREYVPGDRWSRISWSALARTGGLHVRQEDPVVDELVVVVDLAPNLIPAAGMPVDVATQLTRTLGLAAAVVTDALARTVPVRLVTYEPPPRVFDLELDIAARRVDARQPKPERLSAAEAAGSMVDEPVADVTEMQRRLAVADVSGMHLELPPPYVLVNRRGVSFVR